MPFLILILWLGLECWVVSLVGDALDSLALAIWLAVGTSFVGISILGRSRDKLSPDRMNALLMAGGGDPGNALMAVVGPLVGGALLVFPGFITDGLGLLVLFPPTRALLSSVLKKLVFLALKRQLQSGLAAQGMRPEDLEKAFASMKQGAGRPGASGGGREDPPAREADFTVID